MILNKDFNDVSTGAVVVYKAGADVSHLPEDVKYFLADGGHLDKAESFEGMSIVGSGRPEIIKGPVKKRKAK